MDQNKLIDVTVPGNGYVLTNPKLSHFIYWKGRDLDLRRLPLKLAQEMAANPACRFIGVEPPPAAPPAAAAPSRRRSPDEEKA